ncbi:hypothetical protein HDV03_001916 [Kappamyces sp. JEL0829]|nr:hypothetical protein HDV03_001916 [Kappamyces sp. JEL0829]
MSKSDDEETEAPRKLRSQTVSKEASQLERESHMGLPIVVRDSTLVQTAEKEFGANTAKNVKYKDHGYDERPLGRVFVPRFKEESATWLGWQGRHMNKKSREKAAQDLENKLKNHRKLELLEKRIKTRDRDRILFALYNENLEKEKRAKEKLQKILLHTDSAESLLQSPQQSDVELDPVVPRLKSRSARFMADVSYSLVWKGSSPMQMITEGRTAKDVVQEHNIRGLFWSEYAKPASVPIPSAATSPRTTAKRAVPKRPKYPIYPENESLVPLSAVQVVPEVISSSQNRIRIKFKALEPPLPPAAASSKKLAEIPPSTSQPPKRKVGRPRKQPRPSMPNASDAEGDDGKDPDFDLPVATKRLLVSQWRSKRGTEKTGPRASRITSAFGVPLPPMKRLDLDYSDPQWLMLNEMGIF